MLKHKNKTVGKWINPSQVTHPAGSNHTELLEAGTACLSERQSVNCNVDAPAAASGREALSRSILQEQRVTAAMHGMKLRVPGINARKIRDTIGLVGISRSVLILNASYVSKLSRLSTST